MAEFWQLAVDGLGSGTLYAGLALALAVIYAGTGIVNFAQGELAAASSFGAWTLVTHGLDPWLSLLVVVVCGAAVGAIVERVLVRPVERAPDLALITVTVALLLGINGLTAIVWDPDQHTLDSPFGAGALRLGELTVTADQLGAGAVLGVVMVAVGAFFRFTDLGLLMRAVAQDRASAQLLGVRPGPLLALGWALAGAVGAVVGVMAAPSVGVSADMMQGPLLLAFAAAVLGGLGSRVGAVVGGLFIGVGTSLASRYVPGLGGDLALAVPFFVIFIVLLARPEGLFARSEGRPARIPPVGSWRP